MTEKRKQDFMPEEELEDDFPALEISEYSKIGFIAVVNLSFVNFSSLNFYFF